MDAYTLNERAEPVKADVDTWAKRFDRAQRVVAQTSVGNAFVSTVFLGLDHQWGNGPPVLYETMAFVDDKGVEEERYHTAAEACAGHLAMCETMALRENVPVPSITWEFASQKQFAPTVQKEPLLTRTI